MEKSFYIDYLGPNGGNGDGTEFNTIVGKSITGIHILSGERINAIQLGYRKQNGTEFRSETFGSSTGFYKNLELRENEKITAIHGKATQEYLTALSIETNQGRRRVFGNASTGSYFSYKIPDDKIIIGLFGRSSSFLNALGIVIAPVDLDLPEIFK